MADNTPIGVLEWVKRELLSLCEATENDDRLRATAARDGGVAIGMISEAKAIRRTMADIIDMKISFLRDLEEEGGAHG